MSCALQRIFFNCGWREHKLFSAVGKFWDCYLWCLLVVLSLALGVLISMCWSLLRCKFKAWETCLRPPPPQGFPSLWSSPFSDLPWILTALVFLWPNTVSSSRGDHQAQPGLPLPALQLRKFPQEVSWSNHQAQLVDFRFSRVHCPVLPDVQCLKTTLSYISSVWFFFKWEGTSSSHYSILAKSRSPKCVFVIFFSYLSIKRL